MNRNAFAVAITLVATISAQSPAQNSTVLRAARMIDGTGTATVPNAVIVVTDDHIVAAGPAASVTVPSGARVIDLGDVTLLPGFIDAHTHIIGRTLGDPMSDLAVVKDYDSYGATVDRRLRRESGEGRTAESSRNGARAMSFASG